ncbi:hypothetical protein [Mycolicibacterium helvum]|uniref:Uncharacterized protein n=1 Tax=Mycolicibacterium helvum TaxID=1534349 RepID=A0A7I7THZ0_9MYCO|nr:hypothetical protein [Mycolicibacterium helvum]BBY67746.1 hypothetical protein MHEL_59890 [Mycolicibacterium helvum]
MTKYQYSNDTDSDLVIVGVGVVNAGGAIGSDEPIENPNLTIIDTAKKKPINKEPGDVEQAQQ